VDGRAAAVVTRITAIVTAFDRIERTLETLRVLQECRPAPAEVLVHVDGNRRACADAIRRVHPQVRVLLSEISLGPGGARNVLVAAAAHPIVASFDDDSYPLDADYFARLAAVAAAVGEASVIGAAVYHRHEVVAEDRRSAEWVADFSGGACAYRRDHFLETGGYVPIETAYGMEEVDLALRLHARGRRIVQTPWLRVFHDTDLARHADPKVTAASIANIALLTYLRYPPSLWVVGAGQMARRLWWLMGHGRSRGVWRGVTGIPHLLRQYQHARRLVRTHDVLSYLRLRRLPQPARLAAP
jgi:GT2 family glycosyltransferase